MYESFGRIENLYVYASQRHDEDTRQEQAQSMYSRIGTKFSDLISRVAFAEPEILSLPQETLETILNDPVVAPYKFNLEDMLRSRPHTLSDAEETLLARLGNVLSAPGQINGALDNADLIYAPAKDKEGEEHEVSGSTYILLQNSTDRILRKNAFESYYKTFGEHINTFATTYSFNVNANSTLANIKHFGSSREYSMFSENIPTSVYDSLIESVHKNMETMYRYVRLRKKLLGVSELHYYDVYAPLSEAGDKRYTYEEAQELVLKAVSPLGKEYADTVKKAFAEKWIDVYPNKGKRGGAYSSGTYDSNPFILLNFTGTLDSVSTMAHEMGHSMHSYLSHKNQPRQYADYKLFVAEVASTVNENLLIEQLLQQVTEPKEKLALLNQYLEGFKGTLYRQTMFGEFEKITHAMYEDGVALNAASLNKVYKDLLELYFGPDMVLDDVVKFEWARIPHFYRPFYVYKYATSYSASVAISEKILNEGESAVKPYLEFLSMGGSAYPIDELRHAGVDMTTPKPVDLALQKFARVLDEAERVAENITNN